VASSLLTPEGRIPYWVLFDDGYYTQAENNGAMTRAMVAVFWEDVNTFIKYGLGFTRLEPGGDSRLSRVLPYKCPQRTDQYLASVKKNRMHAGPVNGAQFGINQPFGPWHYPDPLNTNWFSLAKTGGRIIFEAIFQNLRYDVLEDAQLPDSTPGCEMARFVHRRERVLPRERKVPSAGYETDPTDPNSGGVATPILEVGFVPYADYELTYTWVGIPWELRPQKAIADCLLKVNNYLWDYKWVPNPTDGVRRPVWGRYQKGDILFMGLASDLEPYRGPSAEWLCDIPYVFRYQPADGKGDGHNRVPRNNGTWCRIRSRDDAHAPLYQSADLAKLFVPEEVG
jgi:hypothetical protein